MGSRGKNSPQQNNPHMATTKADIEGPSHEEDRLTQEPALAVFYQCALFCMHCVHLAPLR